VGLSSARYMGSLTPVCGATGATWSRNRSLRSLVYFAVNHLTPIWWRARWRANPPHNGLELASRTSQRLLLLPDEIQARAWRRKA
jgi:hypothetical protein